MGTQGNGHPQRTVLLVDDEQLVARALSRILISAGWAVKVVDNGHTALSLLRGGLQPAVILLDQDMPFMNGPEFLAALHADPSLASIPVVCMSGHAWPTTVPWFLEKPIPANLLLETIAAAVAKTPR